VATHPLATKKIKPKTAASRSREPMRVIQAGSVLRLRFFWPRGLPERPEGLERRGFGAAL
jgi:hypothetical protein